MLQLLCAADDLPDCPKLQIILMQESLIVSRVHVCIELCVFMYIVVVWCPHTLPDFVALTRVFIVVKAR